MPIIQKKAVSKTKEDHYFIDRFGNLCSTKFRSLGGINVTVIVRDADNRKLDTIKFSQHDKNTVKRAANFLNDKYSVNLTPEMETAQSLFDF